MKTVCIKALIAISTLALTTIFLHTSVFAEDIRGTLDNIEAERREKIEQELLLDLPEISDNPNHIVTFKDPSGKGVELEIDGQGFEKIESPYTLPSLGLGRHTLTFKFEDKEETEQILERTLTVIPRTPILKPPEIKEDSVRVNGTAMPNAEVDLFLINKTSNQRAKADVTPEGNWEFTFSDDIKEGTYTLIGVTRSRGFASNYSEPLVFTVGEGTKTQVENERTEIYFSFGELNFRNPRETLNTLLQNRDLIISFAVLLISGFLLGLLLIGIVNRVSHHKSKKTLKEIIAKRNNNNTGSSGFRNKFSGLGQKKNSEIDDDIAQEIREEFEDEEEIKEDLEKMFLEEEEETNDDMEERKEEKKEEKNEKEEEIAEEGDGKKEEEESSKSLTKKISPKKEEVIKDEEKELASISKEEFLKKYKDFDPDDDDGVEKRHRNIKISLTSKD